MNRLTLFLLHLKVLAGKRVFFFLFIVAIFSASAQTTLAWAKPFGGPGFEYGVVFSFDKDNDMYNAFSFTDSVTISTISGPMSFKSKGLRDFLFMKSDSLGNILWAKQFGGNGGDHIFSIAIDNDYVYLGGICDTACDFDPSINIFKSQKKGSFIAKYTLNGDFKWLKQISGPYGIAIQVDKTGNIYAAGGFQDSVDFDPGAPVYTLGSGSTIPHRYCHYLYKLDSLGNFAWAKAWYSHSNGAVYPSGFHLNDNGEIYISGSFSLVVDVDPTSSIIEFTDHGNGDIYISKFNTAGDFIWAKQLGANRSDNAGFIESDKRGNVYMTGYFRSDSLDFDPGPQQHFIKRRGSWSDGYLLKLDSLGDFKFVKQIVGVSNDDIYSLSLNKQENIYVCGTYSNQCIVDLDTISKPGRNMFVSLFNNTGNLLDQFSFDGTQEVVGAPFIDVDRSGGIYLTGSFSNSIDFDPTGNNFNASAIGVTDAFLLKLDYSIPAKIEEIAKDKNILIYPNPTKDKFEISVSIDHEFNLFDLAGNKLMEMAINKENKEINLSDYASGIYFGRLKSAKGIYSFKIIKL